MTIKKILGAFVFLMFSLAVVSAAADIQVTLLNQDPDPVEQGDVVELRFKIENLGSETFSNIQVEILPDYPFTLYTGDTVKEIGKLQASQIGINSQIVDYKLRVDENAEEGDNEIELVIRAGGLSYSYTSDEFLVDIEKLNLPKIIVHIKDSSVMQTKEKGSITIELANVDVGNANFVELTLLESEDYELLSSSNYVYLGDIDSDDSESEDFDIYVTRVSDGSYLNLPVLVQYQDEDEKNYEEKIDLKLRIYSERELVKLGLKETSKIIPIIIVILILVGAYFYWKKRSRNRA